MRAQGLEARLAVAALLTVLHGCTSTTAPIPELRVARLRWSERGPASYSITVARSCECLVESSAPVVVTVRKGAVESRRYESTGAPVPAEYAELFPPVEGLFEIIHSAQRDGAARIAVSYDRDYGYPSRIEIDFHRMYVDDEITYLARDLQRQ